MAKTESLCWRSRCRSVCSAWWLQLQGDRSWAVTSGAAACSEFGLDIYLPECFDVIGLHMDDFDHIWGDLGFASLNSNGTYGLGLPAVSWRGALPPRTTKGTVMASPALAEMAEKVM